MKKATIGVSLGAALALFACSGGGGGSGSPAAEVKPTDNTEVVATVGNQKITLGELERQLEVQPITRSRLTDMERKREFVDNVVRFELLAQEAQRRGIDKKPQVQDAMRRAMVQLLSEDLFGDLEVEISEEEAREFYEKNIHDYVKPERRRLSHIFFEAPQGDAKRNRVRAEAERALRDLRTKDRDAFSAFAKERSDDNRSKRAGGDLSFRSQKDFEQMWGEEFALAAFSLTSVGQFAELVATEKGFHIVKLLGKQDGLERSFEMVRANIENRLEREKKTQAFEAFIEELREKANPSVDEEVLAKLEGGPRSPDVMPTGGQPGGARPAPTPAKAE